MAKILTHKEYSESFLSKKPSVPAEPVAPHEAHIKAPPVASNDRKVRVEYQLFHPDCSENYKINGKYIVDITGDIIELEIKDGVLRTEDIGIKNHLVSKGLIFIQEREIE